ncbi:F-box protein [Melia azedarach]|uniref:F-box protein n=1 Tax=Melia azedarach TaxID=155640 RepID=A0ACC1YN53_MELAZ|nr:F-box protein [Melia azedarach]
MATLYFSSIVCSSSVSSTYKKTTLPASYVSIPKFIVNGGKELQTLGTASAHVEMKPKMEVKQEREEVTSNSMVLQELHAIMEIVADRAEMHKNIGIQRDNWNRLLLNSVNGMTGTAATMAGLAAVGGVGVEEALLALKLCSGMLYVATTGILLVMNKIQPSQLAEEQRNASRLFKRLHNEIKTTTQHLHIEGCNGESFGSR